MEVLTDARKTTEVDANHTDAQNLRGVDGSPHRRTESCR